MKKRFYLLKEGKISLDSYIASRICIRINAEILKYNCNIRRRVYEKICSTP